VRRGVLWRKHRAFLGAMYGSLPRGVRLRARVNLGHKCQLPARPLVPRSECRPHRLRGGALREPAGALHRELFRCMCTWVLLRCWVDVLHKPGVSSGHVRRDPRAHVRVVQRPVQYWVLLRGSVHVVNRGAVPGWHIWFNHRASICSVFRRVLDGLLLPARFHVTNGGACARARPPLPPLPAPTALPTTFLDFMCTYGAGPFLRPAYVARVVPPPHCERGERADCVPRGAVRKFDGQRNRRLQRSLQARLVLRCRFRVCCRRAVPIRYVWKYERARHGAVLRRLPAGILLCCRLNEPARDAMPRGQVRRAGGPRGPKLLR
jgi:hypothetical protein